MSDEKKRSTTPQTLNGLRRSESGDPYEGVPDNARILAICPRCGNREELTVKVFKTIKRCGACRLKVDRARVFVAKASEVERDWREEERIRKAPRIFDMAGRAIRPARKDN